MSLIVSKKFLKEISSKYHVFSKKKISSVLKYTYFPIELCGNVTCSLPQKTASLTGLEPGPPLPKVRFATSCATPPDILHLFIYLNLYELSLHSQQISIFITNHFCTFDMEAKYLHMPFNLDI